MTTPRDRAILGVLVFTLMIAITALIVAIIAEVNYKSNEEAITQAPTSVKAANGFGGRIEDQTLQISTSVDGILKGSSPNIEAATNQDITSAKLTGLDTSLTGNVTDEDSILSGLGKVVHSINAGGGGGVVTTVEEQNGFGAAIGPNLVLTTVILGLLKGNSNGALEQATPMDIYNQILTTFNPAVTPGTISNLNNIIEAIQICYANINAIDITTNNGFKSSKTGYEFDIALDIATSGLLQTDGTGIIELANDQTVTNTPLTGLVTVPPGVISATDSVRGAIQKLIANIGSNSANIIAGHGFQDSVGPSLSVLIDVTGLLKGNAASGDVTAASASDITGQILTGLNVLAGTFDDTNSILFAIGTLYGNFLQLQIATSNGFSGTFNPALSQFTLQTTVSSGLVKSNGTQFLAATASDITSQLLTGFAQTTGIIDASSSILSGLEKLYGNFLQLQVESKNGFSGTFDPTLSQFTLQTSVADGLVRSNGTGFATATDADVTSKLLTGVNFTPGTVTASSSILEAFGAMYANYLAFSVTSANGLSGSFSTSTNQVTLTTSVVAGLVRSNGTGFATATDADVTSKVLTGVNFTTGAVTGSSSILQSIGTVYANYTAFGVASTNGFAGSFSTSTNQVTLTTSVAAGLVRSNGTGFATATDADVTSKLLTGAIFTPGPVNALSSMLQAISAMYGNYTAFGVASANGLSGSFSTTTNSVTLTTSVVAGLVRSDGTGLAAATDADVTGKQLTGVNFTPGPVTASSTILESIGAMYANYTSLGIASANGLSGSFSTSTNSITLTTSVTAGLVRSNGTGFATATNADVTSKTLSGVSFTPGTLSSSSTILQGIGTNYANHVAIKIDAVNGFASSTIDNTNSISLKLSVAAGLVRSNGPSNGFAPALATDVNGQLLTGFSAVTGTVSSASSIVGSISTLYGNWLTPSYALFATNVASNSGSTLFGIGTARCLALTNMSKISGTSDWTLNANTVGGTFNQVATYGGTLTRMFRVELILSVTNLSSSTDLRFWMQQSNILNATAISPAVRGQIRFVAGGPLITTQVVSTNYYTLDVAASTIYLQPAGLVSTASTVAFEYAQISISSV